MSLRIGVLADSFNPVRSAHLDLCRAALADGSAERVYLVICGDPESCGVSAEKRWQMLVTACAGSKTVSPFRLPEKKEDADPERILRYLQKKQPKDHFILFSAGDCNPDSSLPFPVEEYCSCMGLYGYSPRLENAGSWIESLFSSLKPHRFSHSLSVAYTSLKLAVRYGIDPVRAETAGLLHDCAKCLSLNEMREIALRFHLTKDPGFLESPALLHSVVGAQVAKLRYGIADQEILDAIAFHNTGHAGMSRLAMCICLADFIEPNREPFPLLEDVRRLAEISLEKALLLSLEGVADHVRSRGQNLHPRTLDTIAWLKSLPEVSESTE